MAPPPVDAGAVQDTSDEALELEVAEAAVGAPGVPTFSELEAAEAAPVPAELMAATVNVYVVPVVRPVTVQPVVAVEQVSPPGDEVAV